MHPLYKLHQATLLGRIKAHEMGKLSGSMDKIPSQQTFFRELFQLWKLNPLAGLFYFKLLDCWRINRLDFPASFDSKSVRIILKRLNRPECFDRIYAEGQAEGEIGCPPFGCLILGHRTTSNEPGYYAAVYNDKDKERCSFCSLSPDGTAGNGRISILTSDGWKKISPTEVARYTPARVMMATFRHHLDKVDPRNGSVSEIEIDPSFDPPFDNELMRHLKAVTDGNMQITTATTALKHIAPNSTDFCLKISNFDLHPLAARIRRGYHPTLLVYWNGSKFIMSDDYVYYAAYRQAESERASVAILGDFPKHMVSIEQCGGVELLPPVSMGSTAVYAQPATEEFKSWQLDEKFRSGLRKDLPSHLIAVWMRFADLLYDKEVNERELHQFILKHPEALTVYGKEIQTEIRLGNKYRIDLAVYSSGVTSEVTLIELEHHRHNIFTANGRPRSKITHAVQQAQDWFRWLRENPTDPFTESLHAVPPKGLVVAGRSRDFSGDQRSRLAHINSTSAVPIITYDELLDRLGDFILSQIDEDESK